MVDPKLGTKRVCESCGAKFYDLNKQPATCPKCGHAFDPMAAFVKTEPVRKIEPSVEEEDNDVLANESDAISLDDVDVDDGEGDDDDEADDETQALAEFDDDGALLDEEEDDDEDSFLADEEDDD